MQLRLWLVLISRSRYLGKTMASLPENYMWESLNGFNDVNSYHLISSDGKCSWGIWSVKQPVIPQNGIEIEAASIIDWMCVLATNERKRNALARKNLCIILIILFLQIKTTDRFLFTILILTFDEWNQFMYVHCTTAIFRLLLLFNCYLLLVHTWAIIFYFYIVHV